MIALQSNAADTSYIGSITRSTEMVNIMKQYTYVTVERLWFRIREIERKFLYVTNYLDDWKGFPVGPTRVLYIEGPILASGCGSACSRRFGSPSTRWLESDRSRPVQGRDLKTIKFYA